MADSNSTEAQREKLASALSKIGTVLNTLNKLGPDLDEGSIENPGVIVEALTEKAGRLCDACLVSLGAVAVGGNWEVTNHG